MAVERKVALYCVNELYEASMNDYKGFVAISLSGGDPADRALY